MTRKEGPKAGSQILTSIVCDSSVCSSPPRALRPEPRRVNGRKRLILPASRDWRQTTPWSNPRTQVSKGGWDRGLLDHSTATASLERLANEEVRPPETPPGNERA
jgi:hypothetical protein